jgi:hypothetical protein
MGLFFYEAVIPGASLIRQMTEISFWNSGTGVSPIVFGVMDAVVVGDDFLWMGRVEVGIVIQSSLIVTRL